MAFVSAVYTVNTTNATPTLIRQQALSVGAFRVTVYGRQTTQIPRDDFYVTIRAFALYQDDEAGWVSDGVTIVEEGSAAAVAAWDVTAVVNGANLDISVVGEAGKNITWNLFLEQLQSP